MTRSLVPLPEPIIKPIVKAALAEDLGLGGDMTSQAVIPAYLTSEAEIVARQPGVMAGTDLARATYQELDPRVEVCLEISDGTTVQTGDQIGRIRGPAQSILTGERVALNFLGHLSGIATTTSQFVAKVAGFPTRITCTRKTTPSLRALEKHAVRAGGGTNHRFALDDAVLIKDNHIAMSGDIRTAIARAKNHVGHMTKIEVEVDLLSQLEQVMEIGVDAVLLDNMNAETLTHAVAIIDGRAIAEASGGITLENVAEVAATGVDLISIGALTHSAPNFDCAMDYPAEH